MSKEAIEQKIGLDDIVTVKGKPEQVFKVITVYGNNTYQLLKCGVQGIHTETVSGNKISVERKSKKSQQPVIPKQTNRSREDMAVPDLDI